ncbi:MAG: hypothetical protein ABWW69_04855 [Pyrodictiaceae archaeon]
MTKRCIRIINGIRIIKDFMEKYKRELYAYNSMISETGYYLKPVHIVVRTMPNGEKRSYYYYGRYWWKIVYIGKRGRTSRIKWKYLGKRKPLELSKYPEPPPNPLEGLSYYVQDNDIIVRKKIYEAFKNIFKNAVTIEVDC